MEFNHKSTPNNNNQQKPPTTFLSQPSSRIFRVSRASGGKDRHSKVLTSKGLRDRRVRLSVSTAIQFYDLQDRLGFDQPSKAIEWLIRASSSAISQLPSLVSSFPEFPEIEPASSSTSETSKGSVLSLSRSEIRVKARERARIRAAKDKEDHLLQDMNQSSFTELLSEAAQIQEILRPTSFCSTKGQIFSTSSSSLAMMNYNMGSAGGDHAVMQQFSLGNDHIDCSQNFSFVPGLACFQRGTLQSNPPFSPTCSSLDGQNLPFVFGSVASSAEAQFSSIFDSRTKEPITPFCLDGYRPLDLKGKKKN